jgi:hypothetical protein
MSQNSTRACIQCGTQNPLSQPFCSNCGARQDVSVPNIPGAFPGKDISSGQSNPYVEQSSPYQGQGTPSTQYGGGYQQGYQSPQQPGYQQPQQQGYQQTPSYAQPQQNSGSAATGIVAMLLGLFVLREVRGRLIGCLFTLIIVFAIIGCALLSHH